MMWNRLISLMANRKRQIQNRESELQRRMREFKREFDVNEELIAEKSQMIQYLEDEFWRVDGPQVLAASELKKKKHKIEFLAIERASLEKQLEEIAEGMEKVGGELSQVKSKIKKLSQKEEKYRFLQRQEAWQMTCQDLKAEELELEELIHTRKVEA